MQSHFYVKHGEPLRASFTARRRLTASIGEFPGSRQALSAASPLGSAVRLDTTNGEVRGRVTTHGRVIIRVNHSRKSESASFVACVSSVLSTISANNLPRSHTLSFLVYRPCLFPPVLTALSERKLFEIKIVVQALLDCYLHLSCHITAPVFGPLIKGNVEVRFRGLCYEVRVADMLNQIV